MMKRVSHKILACILGICLIVGLIPLSTIMADNDSTSGTGSVSVSGTGEVSYEAKWSDSSKINLSITPTVNGTAYYLIQDSSSASSADLEAPTDLVSSGTSVICKAGETKTVTISSGTTDAHDIYVTYVDSDGNSYELTKLELQASSASDSSVTKTVTQEMSCNASVKAERTSESEMTMTLTATYPGTFYYIVQSATETAPSLETVISSGTKVNYVSAKSDVTKAVTGLSADKQTLYLVYKDASGLLTSELTSVDVPAYTTQSYSATIDATSYDFGSVVYGYTAPTAKDFTITNTGADTINFALAENSYTGFTVTLASTSVAAGETTTLKVQPKTGLDVGTYKSTITLNATSGSTTSVNAVSADGSTTTLFTLSTDVTFVVTKATTNVYDYQFVTNSLALGNNLYSKVTNGTYTYTAYCINKLHPVVTGNDNDDARFMKITDPSASVVKSHSGCKTYPGHPYGTDTDIEATTLTNHLKYVLYYGYPNNMGGLKKKYNLSDTQFYYVTQAAVWYFTDFLYDTSSQSTDDFDILSSLISAYYHDVLVDQTSNSGKMTNTFSALIHKTVSDVTELDNWDDINQIQLYIFENSTTAVNGSHEGELHQNLIASEISTTSTAETTATLKATKKVAGDSYTLSGDDFTFTLAGEDNASTATLTDLDTTVTNAADGSITFPAITFTEEGTYNYTITEERGNIAGMTYDTTAHTAKVVVSRETDGSLTAAVTYDGSADSLTITNTYSSNTTEAKVTLTAEKTVTGDSYTLAAGDFTFTLAGADNASTATLRGLDTTVTNAADGSITFPTITYTEEGTYNYTITENRGNLAGMTYDKGEHKATVEVSETSGSLTATMMYDNSTAPITFTNNYNAPKDTATLKATKVVTGDAYTLAAGDFSFKLAGADDVSTATLEGINTTVTNAADGSITFPTITYTSAGTYNYTITEESGSKAGMTYDTTVHKAKVVVSKETDGSLTAAVTYDDSADSLTITNTLKTTNTSDTSTSIDVTVTKKWSDAGNTSSRPSADNFKSWVSLYNGSTEVTVAKETVTDNGDGTYTIQYTDLPKYASDGSEISYTVKETIPSGSPYTSADTEVSDGGTITNSLTEHHSSSHHSSGGGGNDDHSSSSSHSSNSSSSSTSDTSETTNLEVYKEWAEGLEEEAVTVQLLRNGEAVEGKTAVLSEDNNWYYNFDNLQKNDENGNAYTYSVEEIGGKWTYNLTVNSDGSITITNTLDSTMGAIGARANTTNLVRKNGVPATGDNSRIALYLTLMAASAAGILILYSRKRRSK